MSIHDPAPGDSNSIPPVTPPAAVPDTAPASRSSRFTDGLKSIGRALWFVVSMGIYAVGLVLFYAGRGLIRISGWSSAATEPARGGTTPPPDLTKLR